MDRNDERRPVLVMMLAGGRTKTDIAATFDVSVSQVYRWASERAIKYDVAQEVAAARDRIRARLVEAATVGVQALIEVASDPDARHSDRVHAADRLLHFAGLDPKIEVQHTAIAVESNLDEVQARIERVRGLLGGAVQVIDVEPTIADD